MRVRTEVAALSKTFDYVVPRRVGPRRAGRHPGPRPAARAFRARLGGRGRATDPGDAAATAVDLLPLKSWLGWGPPEDVVDLADWAAWRWAGTVGLLPPRRLARRDRARAAPHLPPTPADVAGPTTTTGSLRGPRRSTTARRDDRAAAARHRSDRPRAVGRRRRAGPRPAAAASSCSSPRPVGRSGSWRGCRAAWRRGNRRAGRRRGPAGPWSSARAAAPGHRCRGWPPRSCSTRTMPAYREESAPTYSAVEVLRERARRAGAPCLLVSPIPPVEVTAPGRTRDRRPARPTRSAPDGPPSNRSTGRGADPRSGHVLRGVRPAGPLGARRSVSRRARPAGLRLQPHRRGAGCWRAPTVASWRSARAAARPSPARRTKRCCAARAVARRGPSCARTVGGSG